MKDELRGKVAIMTGGASGIGLGTAKVFVDAGCTVVIADIQEDRGRRAADSLGDGVAFQKADVASRIEMAALVDFAVQSFGRLDVMFNNAGLTAVPGTNDVS